ncbi:MAG: TrkA family potassium uptake protein [Ruminiclostridium sp.]|nr:TrkA family potassium uptake protein [Ruminiclostridium sp.]
MDKIIVTGGGRVGFYLAKALTERNCQVVIIESRKDICKEIADSLDVPVIWGDGTCADVLEKAGARGADVFVAVTGRDENNLIACQTAKKLFHIPKTVAKANNPKNVDNIKRLGVDIVISATDSIISLLEREVDHSTIKELIPLNDGKAAVYQVELPENFAYSGKEILNISFPESCNIISITRDNELIIPRGKTKLLAGDKLLIVSSTGSVSDVRRVLKLKK